MPHTPVPADELSARLSRLRRAMSERDPAWSMMLLDNKIDLYYLTGTMQEGALVVTPDEAALFVRRSFDCAQRDPCSRISVRRAASAALQKLSPTSRKPSTSPLAQ